MIKIVISVLIYFFGNCTVTDEHINLHEFLNQLNEKQYLIERTEMYSSDFNLTVENIRTEYKLIDQTYNLEKPSTSLQITGDSTLNLFRFHSERYDDALVSFSIGTDSISVDFPTESGHRLIMQIPKKISTNGYEKKRLQIKVISPSTIRISIFFEEENGTIYYWLSKEKGLEFEYFTSEYSRVVGIPKLISR